MYKLQKIGGLAALLEAIIYITLFIVFGAYLKLPATDAAVTEQILFLRENYLILVSTNILGYVIFGIVLSVLTLALYHRLKPHAQIMAQISAVYGFIWVAIIIASGMISNVGLDQTLANTDADKAWALWSFVGVIAEGLGGGNEIVGGVWVLLLSFAGIKDPNFSKPVIWLGFLVGTAGVLTIYPVEVIKIVFGLSQIVWFVWLGVYLLRKNQQQ